MSLMAIVSSVWDGILFALLFLWQLFLDWLFLFISPYKNLDVLWIIIPIWLSWFFSEFFQEKQGTSFGNAITNGAIPLWVAMDWTRYLLGSMARQNLHFSLVMGIKLFMCLLLCIYGLVIIIGGIKGNKYIQRIGRIREVTYLLVVFTPIIYAIVSLTWQYFLGVVLFFPIFYYIIEFIDIRVPDPKAMQIDIEEAKDRTSNQAQAKSSSPSGQPSRQPATQQGYIPQQPRPGQQPYPARNPYPQAPQQQRQMQPQAQQSQMQQRPQTPQQNQQQRPMPPMQR